ncbi:hypothetical protein [Cellvibrio mixtus]|uniref:hypothetical protein n=1 Tax=Cellvibrio mixtus TaxID=39650 RepID=UPI000586B539|nr:hypothetical protein [Cellvibrio mixtus]
MVKEFEHHIAWTDAMKYGPGYAGLIGYQRKFSGDLAHILWVLGPNLICEQDAENSAEKMLDQISEITCFGRVVYADGVML